MTFTVTYRDQTGTKREEAVEAESRTACVAVCRARGISLVAIREGKGRKGIKGLKGVNGDGRAVAPRPPQSIPHSHNSIFSHFHISTNLAILAFLGILGAAWWWYGARGAPALPDDAPIKPRGMPKEVKPAKAPRPQQAAPVASMSTAKVAARPVPGAAPGQAPAEPPGALPAPVLAPPPTNRTFKTTTEQVLSHLFMTHVGEMPFPVPNLPQEELANIGDILGRDVPFKDSDDAHALDAKETVAAAKKEFASFIAEGGKPQDFLAYYHEVLRKAFEERMMACSACEKVKEEQPEIYDDFLARVNKRLASKGIKQIERESDDDEPKGDKQ